MKYRKKPVIIEAVQFIDDDYGTLCAIGNLGLKPVIKTNKSGEPKLSIQTLDREMIASIGDYIIKEVNGEFYPCKPDIFEKIYERIECQDE